jgi:Asp-tRNA(Asn)/Glu-tRNA(Gln) amidotransferase A subunit family amidase
LSDAEKDETFRNTDEIKTARNEASIPTDRMRDLLNHLNITTPPEFRIKRVPHPRREEYKAIVKILSRLNVLSHHKGSAFRATYQDAVADAAWQAITTYNRRYHEELKNTIYHLLPQRKKNKSKTSGVKADVPRMLMVHHQDVAAEMSTRLQAAQQEIQKLHDQLRDYDATIRGYQKMVAGEASDLYASETYTWLATSSSPGAKDEPVVNNHSPSGSRTR